MFIENLSAALMRRFDQDKLSYEMAAELCDICSKTINNIVSGKGNPRVTTLEKISKGLGLTPNEILLSPDEEIAPGKECPDCIRWIDACVSNNLPLGSGEAVVCENRAHCPVWKFFA